MARASLKTPPHGPINMLAPKLKTRLIKETSIVTSILSALALLYKDKGFFWRNNSGALKTDRGALLRFGTIGSPDILGVVGPAGRLVAIEVKRPKGKPTAAQKAWLAEAKRHGAIAGVVWSVDDALALLAGAKEASQ